MTKKDYNERYRERLSKENRCQRCGKPKDTDKATCSACLSKRSERYRKSIFGVKV